MGGPRRWARAGGSERGAPAHCASTSSSPQAQRMEQPPNSCHSSRWLPLHFILFSGSASWGMAIRPGSPGHCALAHPCRILWVERALEIVGLQPRDPVPLEAPNKWPPSLASNPEVIMPGLLPPAATLWLCCSRAPCSGVCSPNPPSGPGSAHWNCRNKRNKPFPSASSHVSTLSSFSALEPLHLHCSLSVSSRLL